MIDILNLVYIMIFIPFVCAVLITISKFLPIKIPQYWSFAASLTCSVIVFTISLLTLTYTITYQGYTLENNYPICVIQNILLYFGIYADNLSTIFAFITSLVFFVSNIFSYRYLLQNRQGFERFYICLNLAEFILLCFYMSSNLIQNIAFVMLLTLMEYLFAIFYFQKPGSQTSSEKLFKINIFADYILLIASIAFLYFSTLTPDTVNIPTLGYNNINSLGLYSFASLNPLFFSLICILFIMGALIKCAQFPFCTKISLSSDAPNPIFSIITSPAILATGVFLLLRLYPLLSLTPAVFEVLKIFGIITAILCALIATKENNVKNICSWMATSQTGIAICILGFKMFDIAVFYLLCAGFGVMLISYTLDTISYSTGAQENIKFLGGLRTKVPLITVSFLIGAISLSGFIFSGFYPRAITLGKLFNGQNFIYILLIALCSFLTAFYLFRAYFRIFEGEYRGTIEPKRISRAMGFGIIILLLPCLFFGFIYNKYAPSLFALSDYNEITPPNPFINIFALAASAAGYYLAYNIYFAKRIHSLRIKILRKFAANYFYINNFINFIFDKVIAFFGAILLFFEKYILAVVCSIPFTFTKFISYLTVKLKLRNINTQFFAIILWMFFVSILTSILYFKMGIIR